MTPNSLQSGGDFASFSSINFAAASSRRSYSIVEGTFGGELSFDIFHCHRLPFRGREPEPVEPGLTKRQEKELEAQYNDVV